MNWSEELKKDIYLYRFSELVLMELSNNQKESKTTAVVAHELHLKAFFKALLGQDTIDINS